MYAHAIQPSHGGFAVIYLGREKAITTQAVVEISHNISVCEERVTETHCKPFVPGLPTTTMDEDCQWRRTCQACGNIKIKRLFQISASGIIQICYCWGRTQGTLKAEGRIPTLVFRPSWPVFHILIACSGFYVAIPGGIAHILIGALARSVLHRIIRT
jgi:hypothetical protein